jgi:RimJ/RimL family protein N-acetyltransferase
MQYRRTVKLKDGRECVLRNGTEADAKAVLDVFNLTHEQTDFLASYPDESTLTVEGEAVFLKKQTENDNAIEILAEIEGKAVGLAGISCVRPREKTRHRAEFGISVDEAYWGLGIGRALTEACIECAKAAGYAQVELSVVADNAHAIALYESFGFREYGRNPMGFRSRKTGWQELIDMRLVLDDRPNRQKDAVLFLHGLGGSAEEAAHYRSLFPDCDVIGLDYRGIEPWSAGQEIFDAVLELFGEYRSVSLIGYSLGAYLAMHASVDGLLKKAYFISPVVDMESQILALMAQERVTEEELREKGAIPTEAGPALSWEYLLWVREHPIEWNTPTMILYGEHDNLTPYGTIAAFAEAHDASLTVMPGGEHWFHTDEQMRFLDDWFLRER